jgi:hypothetical protein
MSLSWPAVVGTAINLNVATLGPVGTGDYTIVVLTKPNANHGHVGLTVTTGFPIQQLNDSGIWFGGGDFSGFGTSNNTDWHVIGHSKVSGANAYRWHYWNYSLGGAKTHAAGSGTHANPGTITAIQIGNCDNRGNGLIAVVAIWKRVLSDGEFDSLCTTHLSDWAALAPDALLPLNVAAASVVDVTGHGNDAASVTGTISAGADPPSFDYALGTSVPDPVNLGAGASGQADGRALGDTSGAAGVSGAADGLTLGDASGGAGAGGSGDPVARGDTSGGAGSGGQSDGLALGTGSGGLGAGGSADTLPGLPVVIQDVSGGVGAGGQADTAEISQVVHDTMVMPVLLSALACMQGELAKVTVPPGIYTIRPGDSFEPGADPWFGSECCAGVAWVRLVSNYETDVDRFPDPVPRGEGEGCPPDSWGVVIELGVNRCVPVAADYRGGLVTPAQWLAATQAQMDDGAALRRVLCCLRELYDNSDVAAGQVNPLPLQGGCGGVSMQVTVRQNACDC